MKTKLLPFLLAALVAIVGVLPTVAWAGSPHGPPAARVYVVNQSGGTVRVAVAGGSSRTLSPWQTGDVRAAPGEVTVRATYLQFGVERTLQTDRLFLRPGERSALVLRAERTARLLVTNESPFAARLSIDGKPDATFYAGESKLITARAGQVELAMTGDGRVLERTTLTLRPFEEPRWVVDPPRTGDLLVLNPLPIPIQLVCAKGYTRTVAAYGQTTYERLPVGAFRLTARRVTGELVDSEESLVRAGMRGAWRVDPPRTGLVNLDSDHFLGVEVRLDGERAAALAPDGDARIEAAVGWHELLAVDDRGRVVLSTWVEVEPFEEARVSFGRERHERAYDRDRRDGRYDRDPQADEGDHDHEGHEHPDGASCGMR